MKGCSEIKTQDYVSIFYEEQRYHKPYARLYHTWWAQKMLSFVSSGGRMLDNGCGTGILSEIILGEEIELIGIDISSKMVRCASSRIKKLVLGDSQHLPFNDGVFDLIVGRSLLHHLPDPAQGVNEMHRVLRHDGEMIVVDTNKSIVSVLPRILANKGDHFSDNHKNMRLSELIRIIEQKFMIDRVYHFGFLAYPIGFPDILDIGKYIPFALQLTKTLIKLDELIAHIPIFRTQSWGVMIKGTKLEKL